MEVSKSIHEPLLGPHDFRLLDLLPGTGEEQIRCQLCMASLALRPEYYALSYTWGFEDSPVMIWVNETPHWILNNLHSFLLQLRLMDRRRTIWVDSICINQKDSDEKAISIPLMKEIYTAAQSVLIWLGPHSDGTADLFRYLSLRLAAGASKLGTSRTDSLEELHGNIDSTDSVHELCKKLMHREYWKRTWIIQEIVLARNIRVFCGNSSMPWADFAPMLQLLHHGPSPRLPKSPFQSLCELRKVGANLAFEAASLMKYYPANRESHIESSRRDSTYLPITHHSECKDKRDLIYGVLGLIKDAEYHLKIDYTCTMEELVCSIVSHWKDANVGLQDYYLDLIRRLGVEAPQCFTYAKKVLGGCLTGDVRALLARRHEPRFPCARAVISDVDGETIYVAAEPAQLPSYDLSYDMHLGSTWDLRDDCFRKYCVNENGLGERNEKTTRMWTDVRVRTGDCCIRKTFSARGEGKSWRLILFGRDLQGVEAKSTFLGYGIEMLREAASSPHFEQPGGDVATFFHNIQLQSETVNLESIRPYWSPGFKTSIYEILLLAAFDEVFDAVHWKYDFPRLPDLESFCILEKLRRRPDMAIYGRQRSPAPPYDPFRPRIPRW